MTSSNPEANAIARAEHELLLCCVSPGQESVNRDRIRALVGIDIDWNYLFLLARRHAVLPLLYSSLNRTAADVVPDSEAQRLQKYFLENSARNVLLTAELCSLIERLSRNGIEAIPYKGPMLALFAYNDLSLRRFVDLDIMVRKEDVARSIDLLLAAGYELSKPLSATQRQLLQRTQHNLQFRRHKGQLIVELHWEVASNLFASTVQAEDLWKNLAIRELNGAAIKTLSPEDLIFSLLIHGSRHLWERLLWICDVGWIVSQYDLNWQALLERTRSTKTERMQLMSPAVYIDYEIETGSGLAPKPLGIYFWTTTGEPPVTPAAAGSNQSLLIEGDTEEGVEPQTDEDRKRQEEQPLRVEFQNNILSVKAKKQPLVFVLLKIGEELGIPVDIQYETKDVIDTEISKLSVEDVVRKLSPNIRLFIRADLLHSERRALRLVLTDPTKTAQQGS